MILLFSAFGLPALLQGIDGMSTSREATDAFRDSFNTTLSDKQCETIKNDANDNNLEARAICNDYAPSNNTQLAQRCYELALRICAESDAEGRFIGGLVLLAFASVVLLAGIAALIAECHFISNDDSSKRNTYAALKFDFVFGEKLRKEISSFIERMQKTHGTSLVLYRIHDYSSVKDALTNLNKLKDNYTLSPSENALNESINLTKRLAKQAVKRTELIGARHVLWHSEAIKTYQKKIEPHLPTDLEHTGAMPDSAENSDEEQSLLRP